MTLVRALPGAVAAAVLVSLLLPMPAAGQTCGPVETMPDEGHHHLVSGAQPPVPYRSTPPASGWHFRERGEIRFGVFGEDDALSEAQQVSVLAVGGVVVTHRALDDEAVDALAEVVAAEPDRPVSLTPYDGLEPGQVAMTAWRLRQVCDGVDLDAVAQFIEAHGAAEPDFVMGGQDHVGHGEAPADDGGATAAPPADDAQSGGPWTAVLVAAVLAVLMVGARVLVRTPSGADAGSSKT